MYIGVLAEDKDKGIKKMNVCIIKPIGQRTNAVGIGLFLSSNNIFSFDASVWCTEILRLGSHVMEHDNYTGEELLLDDQITVHVENQVNYS